MHIVIVIYLSKILLNFILKVKTKLFLKIIFENLYILIILTFFLFLLFSFRPSHIFPSLEHIISKSPSISPLFSLNCYVIVIVDGSDS